MKGDGRLALRLLRGAGRRDAIRLAFMLVGVSVAVLGLLIGLTAPRISAAAHRVQLARTPVIGDRTTPSPTPLLVDAGTQTVGDELWTRITVTGATARSPLPPGVAAWPGPGRTLVSPALAALSGHDPAVAAELGRIDPTRIGEAGLTGPDELISYTAVPDDGAASAVAVGGASTDESVTAFGASQADTPSGGSAKVVLLETVLMVVLPGLVFLGICLRLSAVSRGRRAFALALVGMSPSRSAAVYGREMTVIAVVGTSVAFAVYAGVEGPLGSSGLLGVHWFPQQARLGWVLPVVVVAVTSLVVSRLARRTMLAAAARSRSALSEDRPRRSRLLGAILLAPSATALIQINLHGLLTPSAAWAADWLATFVTAAVAVSLVGILLAAPGVIGALARLVGRRGSPGVRLGLRGADFDQIASGRLIALVAALVVAAGLGSAFLVALQRTSLGDPGAARIVFDLAAVGPLDREGLTRLPEAPHVLDIPVSAGGRQLAVEVADCDGETASAAATFPHPGACRSGVQRGDGGVGTAGLTSVTIAGVKVPLPSEPVTHNVTWDVKIPASQAPWLDKLTAGQATYYVSRSTSAYGETLATLHRLFPALPIEAGVKDDVRYALYQQQRGIVRAGLALGLLLSLGAFVVSAVENRWSRERSLVALAALGVRGRVLRTANATRFAFPVFVGSCLAAILGTLGGWAYLSFYGTAEMFSGSVWKSSAAAAVLGTAFSAAVGWITGGGRFQRSALSDF